MQPLSTADVRPPSAYESVRAEARRHLVEVKKDRRIALGELLTVVFENRETVRGVVEELLRAERIEDPGRIAAEVEAFNALIPGDNELSATLFVEITDPAELASRLDALDGLDTAVRLEVAGSRVEPVLEEDPDPTEGPGAVRSLRFRLSDEQRAAMVTSAAEVTLVAEHPGYFARAVLDEGQCQALREDLQIS